MKSICFRLLLNLAAVVSFAFAIAVPTTAMADAITLMIPGIPGDSKIAGQQGAIDVMSLSDDIVNPATAPSPGGGAGAGKAKFGDMMIHKRFDGSSPALFLGLVTGKLFPNAEITFFQQSGGGKLTKSFTIALTTIVVTKFATDDASDQIHLTAQEQINLFYAKIQLKDEVTGNTACFDVLRNVKC